MRERLLHLLAEAAEMEHNLLLSYLYAAFSLRGQGEALDAEEAAAVARWRKTIVGVAVEEMGHLATVNNLIVALGGAPHFDRPNFPVPPGYLAPRFEVHLAPLDEATLDHFVFLERPADAALDDAAPYRQAQSAPRSGGILGVTPSSQDYGTIGELYERIRDGLRVLAAAAEGRTFVCTERQVGAAETGIAGVLVIHDLASAFAALSHIVDQGEGAAARSEDSHFARFTAMQEEWAALKARNPAFAPAHPAARDPVMRRPAGDAERVWVTAPRAAALLDYGNAVYGVLLTLLAQLYQPGPPGPKALAAAAVELMHALSLAGSTLARLPATADAPGIHAGLSFAAPRAHGPRADAGLIAERLAELAPLHERLFPRTPNPVQAALERLAR